MELRFNRILKSNVKEIIPLIQELMENQFEDLVLEKRFSEMFEQNYECWGIYTDDGFIGVFGLWFMTRHYAGRSCEPDHVFIKEPYRSKGIGKLVFSWIYSYARKKGCETSELNTYVSNYPSHKFYYNQGYETWGYHMVKKL